MGLLETLGAPELSSDTEVPIQLAMTFEGVLVGLFSSGFNPAILDQDVKVETYEDRYYGNGDSQTAYRLREGVERFMITDINNPGAGAMAQSGLFIMMDLLGTGAAVGRFNHIPGGCNVLYMDGHVSFIRYPTQAPVTAEMAVMMGQLLGPESAL